MFERMILLFKVNCNGSNNHCRGISKLQWLGNMTCSSELDKNASCEGNFIILRCESNIFLGRVVWWRVMLIFQSWVQVGVTIFFWIVIL